MNIRAFIDRFRDVGIVINEIKVFMSNTYLMTTNMIDYWTDLEIHCLRVDEEQIKDYEVDLVNKILHIYV